MFGWGVSAEKMYTSVLEGILDSKFPEKKWQVINTAVPGYNTYMEIETLENKALAYDPDIVLIEYIGNDLDLPNFIMETTDYLNFKKSFLLAFLKGKITLLRTKIDLIDAPTFLDVGGIRMEGERDISKVPEQYRHMVGWEGFYKAMLKLNKIQNKRGFSVVICISQFFPEFILEKIVKLCEQLNYYVLISQQSCEPSLVLSKKDTHPSVLGHEVIANTLFEFMVENNILNKLLDK